MNIGGDELQSNNRQLIPVTEQGGAIPGFSYRSLSGIYARQAAPAIMQAQTSVSYVTGAHAFKVGFDYLGGDAHEREHGNGLARCSTGSTTACRT